MNNELMNKTYAAMTSGYHDAFWKTMRGSNLAYGDVAQAKISGNGGTFLLPAKTASRYSAALQKMNLFHRIGTTLSQTDGDVVLWMDDMEVQR